LQARSGRGGRVRRIAGVVNLGALFVERGRQGRGGGCVLGFSVGNPSFQNQES